MICCRLTTGLQLYYIVRSGLGGLQSTLQEVSSSLDLTQMAKVDHMDEIGHTSVAFNALLTRVAEVVGEVRGASNSVSVASTVAKTAVYLNHDTSTCKVVE